MTVKSADKKPEKYVGPDGKVRIRMVPVDREVVKSEAYNEPQGQAKRIMSPLQKARMDKEKADRDKDGKLKSEGKSFEEFREAMTPVGQRDKMKIIDRKPHPDGGHIITMQTKAGKTIKRHLKNGKVKDMKEEVNEISKKTAQSYLDKTKGDDAFSGTRKANNRLKGAIHAVGIKRKKESVDEVLDTPAAMDRYHNKAKAQSDRARNSATAKIVRGNKDISKEKDVIRKREKGMDMATNVRAKQFRKSIGRGYKGEATMKTFKQLKEDMDKIKKPSASERNVKISQSGRWSQYHGYAGKGATTHDMHDHAKEVAKEYPNHKGVQSTAKKHSEHITALHHAHMALKAAEDTMMKSKRELDKHALDARPAR